MRGSFPRTKTRRRWRRGARAGDAAGSESGGVSSKPHEASDGTADSGAEFEEIGAAVGISRERARELHDEALEASLGEPK